MIIIIFVQNIIEACEAGNASDAFTLKGCWLYEN